MKKTYAYLLNELVSAYIGKLTNMYYWDRECDRDPKNTVYIKIRNDYAKEAGALYKIIAEEVGQDDIDTMHETAESAATKM